MFTPKYIYITAQLNHIYRIVDTITIMKNIVVHLGSNKQYDGIISEPIGATKKIIIHVHGMAGSYTDHNFYPDMHKYYQEHEVAFLVVEHSGTGSRGAATERFERCVDDIRLWIDKAEEMGYTQIWLQGHSLGTPKIAYYMDQTHDQRVKGLILISPSEMIGLVHDPIGQIDYDAMYPEAVKLVAEHKDDQLLPHKLWESVEMSAGTFLNLFDAGSKAGIFNYADSRLGWEVVNKISVPVLAITGTKDDGIVTVMEAQAAMKKLESELKNCSRVETIVYDGAEHDFVGFEKNIVKDVIRFVNN